MVVDVAMEADGIKVVISVEEVGHFDFPLGVAFYFCSKELFFRQVVVEDSSFENV